MHQKEASGQEPPASNQEVEALRHRVEALERELAVTRASLAPAVPGRSPEALADELRSTRRYAVSAADPGAVDHATRSLAELGFCVVDDVIPADRIPALRAEAEQAEHRVAANQARLREALGKFETATDIDAEVARLEQAVARAVDESPRRSTNDDATIEVRPVRHRGRPFKPVNDIVWLPRYAEHLAHPTLVDIAARMLDDHLRIAQLHLRPIAAADPDGTPGGFGRARYRGDKETREWHTDWPHDLSAYGSGHAGLNAGCIRQPFPDVAMCLVMIWYLTDVDEDSAATWVVPGSHRDGRNPRGPDDAMSVTAPIPGDMQVAARAGSVFIQDSRTWHASAMHNPSGRKRVAIVNRWAPWWLAVDDFSPLGLFNTVCRPLSRPEWQALPKALQPLMRHLCADEHDTLQPPVLRRAALAAARNRVGFEQLDEDRASLATANAHVRVGSAPPPPED